MINMDLISKYWSMCVYYGFGCFDDTCATTQISRRIWNSLCNHFINLAYSSNNKYILGTGSQYEGNSLLPAETGNGVPGSDIDQMLVNREFQVYPIGNNGDYDLRKYCLQMKRSEHTRPGYCLVEVVGDKKIDLDSYIGHTQQSLQTDFKSLTVNFNMNSSNVNNQGEITGPAVTLVKTYTGGPLSHDAVTCFASNHWPDECRSWPDLITWPSVTLQKAIRKEGFHIVRVGHPLSPEMDKEWRLSFSVAEKMLIHSFNPTQLTCAVVMKYFLNNYIKPVVPDSIHSYHIKTLMLWSVEQDTDQKWEPQYFLNCLKHLLMNLVKCIHAGKLQHYFIPDNNLFQYKVTRENKEILLQKVKELQESIVDKCITLLGVNLELIFELSSFEFLIHTHQAYSLKKTAFRLFCEHKTVLNNVMLHTICLEMKFVLKHWMNDFYKNEHQLCISMIQGLLSMFECNFPNSNNQPYTRSDKWFSYFKTWCGSILIALYKSKVTDHSMKGNPTSKCSYCDEICNICSICPYLLTKSYKYASTTGCIKMALVYMSNANHYHAVTLLNKSLNIIDQLYNFSLYKPGEKYFTEYNFTEYMHLYNDQQLMENELWSEILNDGVLCETPFTWLEISLLPSLLQLELTHTFYEVDILTILEDPHLFINPFQFWNPIPLTHFLLFVCHYELLKSVTFLDPACLQDDIGELNSLIHDRRRLRQDVVPSLLNLLVWCYLKMGNDNSMVKYAVKTVQQSTGCDKTLFSHLFIQHLMCAVIGQDVRCYVPGRKVLVYDRKLF